MATTARRATPIQPTGWAANAFSPIFCTAAGEAIQSAVESKIWSMNAPSGAARVICTAYGRGRGAGLRGAARRGPATAARGRHDGEQQGGRAGDQASSG